MITARERRRRRKCPTPNKRSWKDRGNAQQAATDARHVLEPYRCPCGGWHLTSERHRADVLHRHRQLAEKAATNMGLRMGRTITRAIATITYRMESGR